VEAVPRWFATGGTARLQPVRVLKVKEDILIDLKINDRIYPFLTTKYLYLNS
jgi:hypothetical protein